MRRSTTAARTPSTSRAATCLNINDHVLAIGISQRTEPGRHRSAGSNKRVQRRDVHHRHHPGVQHPGVPRLHAPGHGVLPPDRLRQVYHPSRINMGPLTVSRSPRRQRRHQDSRARRGSESILTEYVGQPVKLIPPGGGGDRIAAESASSGTTAPTPCACAPHRGGVYQRNNVTNDVARTASTAWSCRPRSLPAAVAARAACPCRLARGYSGLSSSKRRPISPLSAASPLRRNSHG